MISKGPEQTLCGAAHFTTYILEGGSILYYILQFLWSILHFPTRSPVPIQQGTFSDIQAYKRTFATLVTNTRMHSHTSPRYCQACCVLKTTGHPRHEKNNRGLTVQQSAILKIPTFSKCFALGSERVLGQFDKQQQMKAFIFYSRARVDTAHSLPLFQSLGTSPLTILAFQNSRVEWPFKGQ